MDNKWVEEYDGEAFEPPRIDHETCPRCGYAHRFPRRRQDEHFSERASEIVGMFQEQFYSELEWLDDMFPDTPIIEAMEKRCEEMMEALELVKKSFENDLSFEEECRLNNILNRYKRE